MDSFVYALVQLGDLFDGLSFARQVVSALGLRDWAFGAQDVCVSTDHVQLGLRNVHVAEVVPEATRRSVGVRRAGDIRRRVFRVGFLVLRVL